MTRVFSEGTLTIVIGPEFEYKVYSGIHEIKSVESIELVLNKETKQGSIKLLKKNYKDKLEVEQDQRLLSIFKWLKSLIG